MKKIKILTPVQHDKDLLDVGDTVEMTIKQADALIEAGAAEETSEKVKPEADKHDAHKKK
jgi:hypothetical protein